MTLVPEEAEKRGASTTDKHVDTPDAVNKKNSETTPLTHSKKDEHNNTHTLMPLTLVVVGSSINDTANKEDTLHINLITVCYAHVLLFCSTLSPSDKDNWVLLVHTNVTNLKGVAAPIL